MSKNKLLTLKNKIENLDVNYHIKILNILCDHDIKFSENRNGIFLNMNNLTNKTIKEIEQVLKYIDMQEKNLQEVESIKNELNNDFFSKTNNIDKDNKDIDKNFKYTS